MSCPQHPCLETSAAVSCALVRAAITSVVLTNPFGRTVVDEPGWRLSMQSAGFTKGLAWGWNNYMNLVFAALGYRVFAVYPLDDGTTTPCRSSKIRVHRKAAAGDLGRGSGEHQGDPEGSRVRGLRGDRGIRRQASARHYATTLRACARGADIAKPHATAEERCAAHARPPADSAGCDGLVGDVLGLRPFRSYPVSLNEARKMGSASEEKDDDDNAKQARSRDRLHVH
jgi:hypothetical protein